jgi:hypothetical protein
VIVKLVKALYGTIEAANLWFKNISATLMRMSYKAIGSDKCVFTKKVGEAVSCVTLYVDDLFFRGDSELIKSDLRALTDVYKEITVNEGMRQSYLGMLFDFGVPGQVSINMDKYVHDVLEECKSVRGLVPTPAKDDFLHVDVNPTVLGYVDKMTYHSLVAKLLYLAKRARPDILFPVIWLSTRVQEPTDEDYAKLKRVIRYLRGTPKLGIVLKVGAEPQLNISVDASFGVHSDGKSHSGVAVSYGFGPLFVSSRKQGIVTKSSTEAELVATSDVSGLVYDVLGTLRDLGETVPHAVVHQDNQSTIRMIANGAPTSLRSKHIHIRYFYLKQLSEDGVVVIRYTQTGDMVADLLTKPLQGAAFEAARNRLMNIKV